MTIASHLICDMISAIVWRYDSMFVPTWLTDRDRTGATEGRRLACGEAATELGVLLTCMW